MSYATLDQLYAQGAPARSFGQVPPSVHQQALDARDAWINSFLRGRYPDAVPLLAPIDPEIVRAECVAAAYDLMNVRGYNPASGADVNLRDRFVQVQEWLNAVQRQAAHPLITPPSNGTPAQRPLPRVHSGTPRGI